MDSIMCTKMVVEWTVEGKRKWTVECVVYRMAVEGALEWIVEWIVECVLEW